MPCPPSLCAHAPLAHLQRGRGPRGLAEEVQGPQAQPLAGGRAARACAPQRGRARERYRLVQLVQQLLRRGGEGRQGQVRNVKGSSSCC